MINESVWNSLVIAVLGGDEREQEIARLAATTGARVRAFGFPFPAVGIDGVEASASAAAAVAGARFVLMPIPGIAPDGSLFATQNIVPREELLSQLAPRAHIILGVADAGLRVVAECLGIGIHEYETDQELMLLRAPAIVEGALKIMIENTRVTLHNTPICIVGLGNIGTVLARTLLALGARVAVAARNPVQRATAYALGAEPLLLAALAEHAHRFRVFASTVPAPVVTADIIDRMQSPALVMDMSAPPGGVDLAYAEKLGHKAVWARALGRRAPITVGASQWSGIVKIIDRLLRA